MQTYVKIRELLPLVPHGQGNGILEQASFGIVFH